MTVGLADEIRKDQSEALRLLEFSNLPNLGAEQRIKYLREAAFLMMRTLDRVSIQTQMLIEGQLGPGKVGPKGQRSGPGGTP